MAVQLQSRQVDTTTANVPPSCRSSTSEHTLYSSEPTTPISIDMQKLEKQQRKKVKRQQVKRQHPTAKSEKPFHQTVGEMLLESTTTHPPPLPDSLVKVPPKLVEVQMLSTPLSEKLEYFPSVSVDPQDLLKRNQSAPSLTLPRPSIESNYSSVTKVIRDDEDPSIKYRVKGVVYSLDDFMLLDTTEDLILRYGRVAHMGVRDHSYNFWMNSVRTAVVHFKVLNKVAVLGGDPICHSDHIGSTFREFESYCRKIGWGIAVVGGSTHMAELAKQNRWTCMKFGIERVLNPQTNEIVLGKSGKRIITQCKQLLDPARGAITLHIYSPSHSRDPEIESSLHALYDTWCNERNASCESQAFVTVFDLFTMSSLMTYVYTTDNVGKVNGFAALRKLGATNGYHIDPFIQSSSAPRGVSDLLIYASLALLNLQGCSHLSLGYEPVTELNEISGLPTILHSATKEVYRHVFGKIPIGGKKAFHAKWKPDESQEAPLHLIITGKIPSPRYLVAMTHFANISIRQILASDWQALTAKQPAPKKQTAIATVIGVVDSDSEIPNRTQAKSQQLTQAFKDASIKLAEKLFKSVAAA